MIISRKISSNRPLRHVHRRARALIRHALANPSAWPIRDGLEALQHGAALICSQLMTDSHARLKADLRAMHADKPEFCA
jgi:hypothetical protein